MGYSLSNEFLTVGTKPEGAELTSIKSKKDGIEYLWAADPNFWNRHAPVLFPIVGKLKDNKTIIENRECAMTQHGFARDMTFSTAKHEQNSITYLLESSDESKKKYPYDFKLYIGYRLENSSLEVSYTVVNTDNKTIYFSIGAHPGFNCPLAEGEDFTDYYLEFDSPELIDSYRLRDGVIGGKELLFDKEVTTLDVSKELFENDAIMLENMASTELTLKSRKSGRGLTLNYKGFPYLGIWSKPEGAPFVCIEPWFGIADTADNTGVFEKKKGIVSLGVGEEFNCKFTIRVF